MKLECGMYVRFDYHRITVPIQIGKITKVYYEEPENSYHYLTDMGLVIGEDNLVKEPSHNIIDLIEAGDYVNGMEVTRISGTRYDDNDLHCYCEHNGNENWKRVMIPVKDIKSIVTKEMFSSMEYKVGE